MLAVTVEVWPGGDIRRRKVIHTLAFANVSNLDEISTYEVFIDGERVDDIPEHRRSEGALKLIAMALEQEGYLE